MNDKIAKFSIGDSVHIMSLGTPCRVRAHVVGVYLVDAKHEYTIVTVAGVLYRGVFENSIHRNACRSLGGY